MQAFLILSSYIEHERWVKMKRTAWNYGNILCVLCPVLRAYILGHPVKVRPQTLFNKNKGFSKRSFAQIALTLSDSNCIIAEKHAQEDKITANGF